MYRLVATFYNGMRAPSRLPMILLAVLGLFPISAGGGSFPTFDFTSGMGVQVHYPHWAADPEGTLRRIRSAGFTWIRDDMTWTTIEPRKGGPWNWRETDRLLDAAQANGLRVVATLAFSNPAYGVNSDKVGPVGDEIRAAYVRYAVATVKRYRGRGILWEIWNEPDWKFWLPDSDEEAYVRLAKETSAAIRRSVPGETVVGPATSAENPEWLERAFRLGLLDSLDAVTVHPYRQDSPERNGERMYGHRALVRKYGKGRSLPVFVGEWGYSENYGPPNRRLGLSRSSTYASRIHATALSEGAPLSILYVWQDDVPSVNSVLQKFGITRRNGTWKPAAEAISTLSAQLEGFRYAGRLAQPDARARVAIFRRGSEVRLLGLRTGDEAGFMELPGPVRNTRRQPALDPTEVGDEMARGFDPAAPRSLYAPEDPVVIQSAGDPDADTVALGRFPVLPAVLGVWSTAGAKSALDRIVAAIPPEATAVGIGERSPTVPGRKWLYDGPRAKLGSAAIDSIATRISHSGHRLLLLRIKMPGAREMTIETLLR